MRAPADLRLRFGRESGENAARPGRGTDAGYEDGAKMHHKMPLTLAAGGVGAQMRLAPPCAVAQEKGRSVKHGRAVPASANALKSWLSKRGQQKTGTAKRRRAKEAG